MSSDKFQRQMDFIIEQQAKFDARFDAKMLKIEDKQRQNTEDIVKLVGAIMNLTLHGQENSRQIAELIEHGKETDKRIGEPHTHDRHRARPSPRLGMPLRAIAGAGRRLRPGDEGLPPRP